MLLETNNRAVRFLGGKLSLNDALPKKIKEIFAFPTPDTLIC